MRPIFVAATTLFVVVAIGSKPATAGVYNWLLDAGGGLTGSGSLTTGAADNGGFDITSFTGTIGGDGVSLLGGDPGISVTSPSGAFIYDNLLYTTVDPLLDESGLLFSIAGKEGNVWGNGTAGSYSYYTFNGGGYDYANGSVSFTLTLASGAAAVAAAEPSTVAIFAVGLVSFGLIRRRRDQSAGARLVT